MTDPIAQNYIQIAVSLDALSPGYIDSHALNDEELKDYRSNCLALEDIPDVCDVFLQELSSNSAPKVRLDFLVAQVRAMKHKAKALRHPGQSLKEDARRYLDLDPSPIPDAYFDEQRKRIEAALPACPRGIIHRIRQFETAGRVDIDATAPVLRRALSALQQRTRKLFNLPHEEVEVSTYSDRPSIGYHRFVGQNRSLVELNSNIIMDAVKLLNLIAHEAYPGHHTDMVLKQKALVTGLGWREHALALLDVPSCIIAEGIATNGLSVLYTPQECTELCKELMCMDGYDPATAQPRIEVEAAQQNLRHVIHNVALMLDDADEDEANLISYIKDRALVDTAEAERMFRFVRHVRAFALTYYEGNRRVAAYLNKASDRVQAFGGLLCSPVTPKSVLRLENTEYA